MPIGFSVGDGEDVIRACNEEATNAEFAARDLDVVGGVNGLWQRARLDADSLQRHNDHSMNKYKDNINSSSNSDDGDNLW